MGGPIFEGGSLSGGNVELAESSFVVSRNLKYNIVPANISRDPTYLYPSFYAINKEGKWLDKKL